MTGSNSAAALILACGALAHEIQAISRLNGWSTSTLKVQCLPADWHNHPQRIIPGLQERLERCLTDNQRIACVLIGYADCGTGGSLDAALKTWSRQWPQVQFERLPGAHCYQFFAGQRRFLQMQDAEPGTLYLTDFLLQHFDRLIIQGLGLDKHPHLLPQYFGHYRRMVFLAQRPPNAYRHTQAAQAALRLGLELEVFPTGYNELQTTLQHVITPALHLPHAGVTPFIPSD